MWFYPCSYICNCLKMPKKSQINEYSDTCPFQTIIDIIHSEVGIYYIVLGF